MKTALTHGIVSRAKRGLGLTFVALVSCAGPQEDVPLAHPLSRRLTYFKTTETFISAAPGVPLGDLCDLKGFRNLRPGMTSEAVSRLYGPPSSTIQEMRGRRTVYIFKLGERGTRVDVVKQMAGSDEPLIEQWALRCSVAGRTLEEIVAPGVLAAIPMAQRGFTLHLSSGEEGATLKFDSGRPDQLWWFGSGKPAGDEWTSMPTRVPRFASPP